MAKTAGAFFPLSIALARGAGEPLYAQLYARLREGILGGSLHRGLRLPSTRALAEELGVSRNIVVLAFEQLAAEGYLEGRTGAGSFVARALPEDILQVRAVGAARGRELARRGAAMLAGAQPALPPSGRLRFAPFRFGLPALEALPLELWGRLLARHCRRASAAAALHGDPRGLPALRAAIAAYVGAARGVRCRPEQVLIVNGSQQGIDLAARVLADPGDSAAVEDPGYAGARAVFAAAGLQLAPVGVGRDGMRVEELVRRKPAVKLVYVTPSHQFPLGAVLSLPKRLRLLEWAARSGAWILEDDFDSEFRYAGRPIPALQGLDQNGRVIYIGTFSKVLFPAVRLGYLIVPEDLVEAFVAARWIADRCSPAVEQAALAEFIAGGHLGRHIRRMRTLYMERQAVLAAAIREELDGGLEVGGEPAGMHLVAWLPAGLADTRVAAEAAAAGIQTLAVSQFALRALSRGGLLLGYAGFAPAALRKAARGLAGIIAGQAVGA
jgi:GntR family transcriptional regulator/MocR family aminotransferase